MQYNGRMDDTTSAEAAPPPPRWRAWLRPAAVGLLFLALNVAVYYLIPADLGDRLGALGYAGASIVTFAANASVVVPVPYFPLLIRLGQTLPWPGVILAGAVGSALGESVAFFVGRAGRGAAQETRFYRWVQRQLRTPARAFAVLLALSAPPNPAFDVAGLLAGAMGVPLWMFLVAVFLGRIVRIALVLLAGNLLPS
jgi:membrane protein YqaA with SNARE-associated domain